MIRPPPNLPFFPYPTLFRSPTYKAVISRRLEMSTGAMLRCTLRNSPETYAASFQPPYVKRTNSIMFPNDVVALLVVAVVTGDGDRKSTRLNSSHLVISYAVF